MCGLIYQPFCDIITNIKNLKEVRSMRYGIIIAIVLLGVFLIWCYYVGRTVSDGYTFVVYAEELIQIYNTYLIVKNQLGVKTFSTEHIQVKYDPENLKFFLDEMDYVIAIALDCYDRVKDKEKSFRKDDWDCVQEKYVEVQKVENRVRYEKWQNGFQVTRFD